MAVIFYIFSSLLIPKCIFMYKIFLMYTPAAEGGGSVQVFMLNYF